MADSAPRIYDNLRKRSDIFRIGPQPLSSRFVPPEPTNYPAHILRRKLRVRQSGASAKIQHRVTSK